MLPSPLSRTSSASSSQLSSSFHSTNSSNTQSSPQSVSQSTMKMGSVNLRRNNAAVSASKYTKGLSLPRKSRIIACGQEIRNLCKQYERENLNGASMWTFGLDVNEEGSAGLQQGESPQSDTGSNINSQDAWLVEFVALFADMMRMKQPGTAEESITAPTCSRVTLEAFQKHIERRMTSFKEFNTALRKKMYEYMTLVLNLDRDRDTTVEIDVQGAFISAQLEKITSNEELDSVDDSSLQLNSSVLASYFAQQTSSTLLSFDTLLKLYLQLKGTTSIINYAIQLLSYEEKRFLTARALMSKLRSMLANLGRTNTLPEAQAESSNASSPFEESTHKLIAKYASTTVQLNSQIKNLKQRLYDIYKEHDTLQKQHEESQTSLSAQIASLERQLAEERELREAEVEKRNFYRQELESQVTNFAIELENTKRNYDNFMEEYEELKEENETLKQMYDKVKRLNQVSQRKRVSKEAQLFENHVKLHEEEIQQLRDQMDLQQQESYLILRETQLELQKWKRRGQKPKDKREVVVSTNVAAASFVEERVRELERSLQKCQRVLAESESQNQELKDKVIELQTVVAKISGCE